MLLGASRCSGAAASASSRCSTPRPSCSRGGASSRSRRAPSPSTRGSRLGTIYRYFSNRDEIIAAYLDHEMGVIEEAVAAGLLLER